MMKRCLLVTILLTAGYLSGWLLQNLFRGAEPGTTTAEAPKASSSLIEILEHRPTGREFEALLHATRHLPDWQREMAQEVLFHHWLTIDATSAHAFAIREGATCQKSLFTAWGKLEDPRPAWIAVQERKRYRPLVLYGMATRDPARSWQTMTAHLPISEWDEDLGLAALHVLRRLATLAPDTFLEVLAEIEVAWKERFGRPVYQGLARSLIDLDPELALSDPDEEPADIIAHWFSINPARAAAWFGKLPTESRIRRSAVLGFAVPHQQLTDEEVLRQLARGDFRYLDRSSDRVASLDRLLSISKRRPEANAIISRYFCRWESDPRAGFDWASRVEPDSVRNHFLEIWIQEWTQYQPDRVLFHLNTLEDDSSYLRFAGALHHLRRNAGLHPPEGTRERIEGALQKLSREQRESLVRDHPEVLPGLFLLAPMEVVELVRSVSPEDANPGKLGALLFEKPKLLSRESRQGWLEPMPPEWKFDLVRAIHHPSRLGRDPYDRLLYLRSVDDSELLHALLLRHLELPPRSTFLYRDQLRSMIESHPSLAPEDRKDLLVELEFLRPAWDQRQEAVDRLFQGQ